MNKPEMLDLVDIDDNVIDTLSREEIYARHLDYIRVIEAIIRNSDGKLWIPTRIMTKAIKPGGYDVGVGGHVEHGETYLEALRKEVSEEVGWDIDKLKYRVVGKFGPQNGLNTISMVYEILTDETPELSTDDFSSAAWMTPQEVVNSVKAGHPAKDNLLPLLHIVYGVKI